jgi:hypothetical protein
MGFGSFRRRRPGDRCVGLPRRHHPLSEFFTLSAASSHPGLVAFFRATSAHRISVSRAFPARPAAAPLGARCSLAVSASSGFSRASSRSTFAPGRSVPHHPTLTEHLRSSCPCYPAVSSRLQPPLEATEVESFEDERPRTAGGGSTRPRVAACTGLRKVTWNTPSQARAYDFRALLQSSVRSRGGTVKNSLEPMLS